MNNKVFFRHSPVLSHEPEKRKELQNKIAEAKALLASLEAEDINLPRYTFAGITEIVTHEDGTVSNKLRIGVARCSGKDQFTKQRGRVIAEGRARKIPLMSSTIPIFTTEEEEKAFNLGKMFYQTTEEIIERLDNGYIKTLD
jgi:hypothetical protein